MCQGTNRIDGIFALQPAVSDANFSARDAVTAPRSDDQRSRVRAVEFRQAAFAYTVGAEDALVRSQFMSGTHTLTVALFGLLRAGDTLLAATRRPSDTLEGVIGIGEAGEGCGTLAEYGIKYDEAPLKPDMTSGLDLIARKAPHATVSHIQRSRGR